jgi:hypothetical protein
MAETDDLPATVEAERLPGLSRRRCQLAERMVFHGESLTVAAEAVGLTRRAAFYAARDARWLGFYRQMCAGLRESMRAKALHRLDALMSQDENRAAAVRAAEHFDAPERGAGQVINIGVQTHVSPGYVVHVSAPRDEIDALLKAAGSTRVAPTIDLQPEPSP